MRTKTLTLVLATVAAASAARAGTPLPDKIPCAIADRQDCQPPDRLHLTGWLGSRIDVNEKNRLVKLDPARLLEGYRKRPGRQAWDGEHVGKWLDAATLAWVYSGDRELRRRLDYVAAELVKCQLDDGYLGTYSPDKRWTVFDVWSHAINLIGLTTYMRYTGNLQPMPACRKMADLLCKTFGDEPGKLDIIRVSNCHAGMNAGGVLEPMVLLYRMTGEPRYLEFCKYQLRVWEQPHGPQIVSRLLKLKRVDKVGNAKAYEMLFCLNGILEFYRTTGDARLLEACLNAWQDIVDKRLYITGTASAHEYFCDDFVLPNVANVGETCVTVTWIQFNAQLLRLTGEARFAEQLERAVLNQLLGAQRPDGTAWGYYVQMEGRKPYSSVLDGHCCLSSGPRGVALAPTFAAGVDADGVVVNLYEAGTAKLTLRNGQTVRLTTDTLYPSDGKIAITVCADSTEPFALKARIPAWCRQPSLKVNGRPVDVKIGADGYAALRRAWAKGDKVELDFKLEPRVIVGNHTNAGKIAVMYGPLVLAADEALLGTEGASMNTLGIASPDLAGLGIAPEAAAGPFRTWPHAQIFRCNAVSFPAAAAGQSGSPLAIRLVPFADAGCTGKPYKVWLPLRRSPPGNVLD